MTLSKIKPRLTSQEIVCATARKAPTSAYLEFDAQPEPRIEQTAKLDKARISNTLRLTSEEGSGIGTRVQSVKAIERARIGESKNNTGEAVEG